MKVSLFATPRAALLAALLALMLAVFVVPARGDPKPGCMASDLSSCSSSVRGASSLETGSSRGSTPERRKFDKTTYNSIKGAFSGTQSDTKKKGKGNKGNKGRRGGGRGGK
ncbi:Glutamine--fructose-6-phosphate aminotransferase [isomerizing] [Frankliniella fusca]|uniref:Glutamine--fructose-6-phosphate aminotransferase [isomerizing] n=1 Tax=Frankliniella fusca TaxID=407009 RepID=A0AAE1HEM6_9NEOP|nr:Glutamine--fructose-6-phosphate aminotransferase [isomerizing] [Frankliniella fusca]